MIKIVALCKKYRQNSVYDKLNLEIKENEITCIIGDSGKGKTTLLRILAGIEKFDSGHIEGLENKTINYMFQDDCLMPWLTVEENIAYVLKSIYSKQEVERKIEYILELLELTEYKTCRPNQLSGGMKRRVSLGRALVYESDIILLDEPFTGLDDRLKSKFYEVLIEFKIKYKKTIIIVTHDLNEARSLGECIYV